MKLGQQALEALQAEITGRIYPGDGPVAAEMIFLCIIGIFQLSLKFLHTGSLHQRFIFFHTQAVVDRYRQGIDIGREHVIIFLCPVYPLDIQKVDLCPAVPDIHFLLFSLQKPPLPFPEGCKIIKLQRHVIIK